MAPDPDYRIITCLSENSDAGKEWLARVTHPRTRLGIFFEAPNEAEVIIKASEFWEQHRKEREENWRKRDEARAKAEAKAARKTKAEAA
jgi:hypothetical protein